MTGVTSNIQDGARLDVAASAFWESRHERAYFEVRVFNPHAPTNRQTQLSTCYQQHKAAKRRAYDQRVREVKHGFFTPLVLSATGGLGKAASVTYKRLAALLSEKWDQPYSHVVGWLCCRLSYSLLRSAILCIRGARSSTGRPGRGHHAPVDLVTTEAMVPVG